MDVEEALEALRRVPERRRRIKLLAVLGFRYEDIAQVTGNSTTRVSQLMREANAALQSARVDMEGDRLRPRSERAQRLDALETQPPGWLIRAIGRRPGWGSNATQLQAWRRAALAIDDYRRLYGAGSELDALGKRPGEERAARAYDLASTAISRFEAALEPGRSLER